MVRTTEMTVLAQREHGQHLCSAVSIQLLLVCARLLCHSGPTTSSEAHSATSRPESTFAEKAKCTDKRTLLDVVGEVKLLLELSRVLNL